MTPSTSPPPRRTRSPLRWLPWVLLGIQIVLCFQFLRATKGLELTMLPDTNGYRLAGRSETLQETLASHRTVVYPAVLRFFDRSGRSWQGIPVLQAAVYFAGVVVFFAGLRIYSGSAWLALAAATPLLYAKSHEFLGWAQTDALSVALTLAVFGLLLFLAARPASRLAWVGLPVALIANYHTRPATLFLIALVPVLAVVLRLCRGRRPLRSMLRWAAGLGAATVLPYLLFALLRLVIVGHFGMVAFGGANLIGVTATFLDKWVIAALPGEDQVLARRMRDRRDDEGWQRLEFHVPAEHYFEQYNFNVWQIAVPVTRWRFRQRTVPKLNDAAAAEEGSRPPPYAKPRAPWIEQNQMMLDLSRKVIRLRPYRYLHWIQQAWRYGLGQVFDDGWLVWLLALIGVSMPLAWVCGRGHDGPEPEPRPGDPERGRPAILLGLLVVTASYFLLHMTLVCLVSYPISRYVIAAALLWPPFLAAELFELWRRILRGLLRA